VESGVLAADDRIGMLVERKKGMSTVVTAVEILGSSPAAEIYIAEVGVVVMSDVTHSRQLACSPLARG
jgi:hypothetical protein